MSITEGSACREPAEPITGDASTSMSATVGRLYACSSSEGKLLLRRPEGWMLFKPLRWHDTQLAACRAGTRVPCGASILSRGSSVGTKHVIHAIY